MSKSDYINDLKKIIVNFTKDKYKEYLNDKKILLIKEEDLKQIINEVYDTNITNIKQEIRSKMREKYKDNYPSAIVENTILDFLQNRDLNIQKTISEIIYVQNINQYTTIIPIINNSLNLNISITDGYVIINHIKDNLHEKYKEYQNTYNTILEYKFLYAINDKILHMYNDDDKINIIKQEINNKNTAELTVYYLKTNIEKL